MRHRFASSQVGYLRLQYCGSVYRRFISILQMLSLKSRERCEGWTALILCDRATEAMASLVKSVFIPGAFWLWGFYSWVLSSAVSIPSAAWILFCILNVHIVSWGRSVLSELTSQNVSNNSLVMSWTVWALKAYKTFSKAQSFKLCELATYLLSIMIDWNLE